MTFFFLFISLNTSYASGEKISFTDVEFGYKLQKLSPFKTAQIISSADHFFQERGIERVFTPPSNGLKLSVDQLDAIYSDRTGKTVVFLKTGVLPTAPELINKIIQFKSGFLTHLKDSDGTVTAAFIKTAQWKIASEISESLKKQLFAARKTSFIDFSFISRAHAEENCDTDPLQMTAQQLSLAASSEHPSHMQLFSQCILSTVKGLWNGSGGALSGTSKALGNAIANPIEAGKQFWEGVENFWESSVKLFSDFENQARAAISAFDSLDPMTKTQLACEVFGSISGAVLMTYFTAGAASSQLFAQIAAKVKQVLDLRKFANVRNLLRSRNSLILETEAELDRDLFSIQRGTAKLSTAKNYEVLDELDAMPVGSSATRKAGLKRDEINELFDQVRDHPVASLSRVNEYSRNSPGMGYCFGRATTAHIKALTNGLHKDSIRKVWALGDLQTGDTNWRYHVTTIIRDDRGKWHAIDPIMGKPMPVEQWYATMKTMDSKGNMRIFTTEAKRFGPSSSQQYSPNSLNSPHYEGYFEDLMGSFRAEARELARQRRAAPNN